MFCVSFNKYPSFYAKKIITTLKKPNSGEARNWFADQQFCREKRKKKKKSMSLGEGGFAGERDKKVEGKERWK